MLQDFINAIDQSKLRGLERSMHLCAAECCVDNTATVEDVHRCIEKCQVREKKSFQYSVCLFLNSGSRYGPVFYPSAEENRYKPQFFSRLRVFHLTDIDS